MTSEKNTALLRNAEISQQMELVKQDMRRQEQDMKELLDKLATLEREYLLLKESKNMEEKLNSSIVELEEQLSEKNKVVSLYSLYSIWLIYCYFADYKNVAIETGRPEKNPATRIKNTERV